MISAEYARVMARYNRWQNRSVFAAADSLGDAARRRDRGAFFGSVHTTLNHLLWADQMWMHRLAETPKPAAPTISASVDLHRDWPDLRVARQAFDETIVGWTSGLSDADLEGDLVFFSGVLQREASQPKWRCLAHMLNHQTHHRGQVHAMLTAAGAKTGDTDLFLMPDDA